MWGKRLGEQFVHVRHWLTASIFLTRETLAVRAAPLVVRSGGIYQNKSKVLIIKFLGALCAAEVTVVRPASGRTQAHRAAHAKFTSSQANSKISKGINDSKPQNA